MVEKRFDEETTETTLELLSSFLDNLSAPQDALTITKIQNQIQQLKQTQLDIYRNLKLKQDEVRQQLETVGEEVRMLRGEIEVANKTVFPIESVNDSIKDQEMMIESLKHQSQTLSQQLSSLQQESSKKPEISKELVSLNLFQQLGIEFFDMQNGRFLKGMASNVFNRE